MVLNRLLLDPDPAPSGGGGVTPPSPAPAVPAAPALTIPTVPNLTRTTLPSAKDSLGLDDSPSKTIGAVFDNNRQRNLPPVTAGFPSEPPKPPAAPATPPPAPAPAPEPPKPAEPAPPVPAPAPEPRKVKIGDKEYTEAELAAIVQKQDQQPPAQPPAPPAPPEAPKVPSPEEIAKAEAEWVSARAQEFKYDVTEEQVERVLEGGKEGAEAFKAILSNVYAKAVLEARKSIFGDLQQDFAGINQMAQVVQSLVQERQALQQYTTEQLFVQEYPEFKDNLDIAREVGQFIVKNYPAQVAQMGQAEFIKLVAKETDKQLLTLTRRVYPDFKYQTWKDYWKSRQTPAPEPPPAPSTPPPPAPVPQPAAPPVPPVRPPAANAPSAPVWTGYSPDQHKSIAKSLRDA